jgi:hypothetical protein
MAGTGSSAVANAWPGLVLASQSPAAEPALVQRFLGPPYATPGCTL